MVAGSKTAPAKALKEYGKEAINDAVGLDLTGLIGAYAGTKNVGAQIRELNSTLKDLGKKESVPTEAVSQ